MCTTPLFGTSSTTRRLSVVSRWNYTRQQRHDRTSGGRTIAATTEPSGTAC